MNHDAPDHLVLEQHNWKGYIFAISFLHSLYFSLPGMDMSGVKSSADESVKCLILPGCSYVKMSSNVFVMSSDVIIQEMSIEELSVCPGSNSFVM